MGETMRVGVYYSNSDVRVEERARPVDRPRRGAGARTGHRASAAPTCSSGTACPRRRSCSGTRWRATSSRWARGSRTVEVGDRVAVSHHVPCNACPECLSGFHTACHTLHTTNFDPGGFAEYVRVPRLQTDRGVLVAARLGQLRGRHVRRAARVRRARPDALGDSARLDGARGRQRHLGPAAHPARRGARSRTHLRDRRERVPSGVGAQRAVRRRSTRSRRESACPTCCARPTTVAWPTW